MPRNAAKRGANGTGSIRKITRTQNGKVYSYWQARYTEGFDPVTGKQIQHSITGKTQKEVAQKLRQCTYDIDRGTYLSPTKLTVGDWVDDWVENFLTAVKPRTRDSYRTTAAVHIKPLLGAKKLQELSLRDVQLWVNTLVNGSKKGKGLSPKTVKNVHGVLHKALEQACELGYIAKNPATGTKLPKVVRKTITPLNRDEVKKFVRFCRNQRFELIFLVTLFSGVREGEVLGLTWSCVDFEHDTITIDKQLQKIRKGDGSYRLVPTKSSKSRIIRLAPYVMNLLRRQKSIQDRWRIEAGSAWSDEWGLVFTNELGKHFSAQTLYLDFKKLAALIGRPDARFHDLRHTYAVIKLENGDDIKTLQEDLGHYSAAFTLDVYGHVTEKMRKASAERMQDYIRCISA